MTTGLRSQAKKKPLADVRILVGRAPHQASALSLQLQALGAEVIKIPFVEICPPHSYKPFDAVLKRIADYDWLILTSVNGVDALSVRMKRLQMGANAFDHLKIAAIGPATRDALYRLGLKTTVVPERYVAESVVESLRRRVKGKQVLLVRAKIARDVIPRELRKAGARVDVVEAYETVVPPGSKKKLRALMANPDRHPHIITFTSSSTVRNFFGLLTQKQLQGTSAIRLASIGPITSATLRKLDFPVHIEAKEYTIPGLIKAIREAIVPANSTK